MENKTFCLLNKSSPIRFIVNGMAGAVIQWHYDSRRKLERRAKLSRKTFLIVHAKNSQTLSRCGCDLFVFLSVIQKNGELSECWCRHSPGWCWRWRWRQTWLDLYFNHAPKTSSYITTSLLRRNNMFCCLLGWLKDTASIRDASASITHLIYHLVGDGRLSRTVANHLTTRRRRQKWTQSCDMLRICLMERLAWCLSASERSS